jgi:cytochrome c
MRWQLAALGAALCVGCSQNQGRTKEGEHDSTFGFGRHATPEEIAAWNIDVMPDGTGLPEGEGTVAEGAALYASACAACHGATGVEGPNDRLVGREPREGFPFGKDPRLSSMRTIGNYWPYATTLYDYINRAMPFDRPGSLDPDDVYSLVAYLLHENEIIAQGDVMNAATLPAVVMPARDRFVRDNRRGGPEIR